MTLGVSRICPSSWMATSAKVCSDAVLAPWARRNRSRAEVRGAEPAAVVLLGLGLGANRGPGAAPGALELDTAAHRRAIDGALEDAGRLACLRRVNVTAKAMLVLFDLALERRRAVAALVGPGELFAVLLKREHGMTGNRLELEEDVPLAIDFRRLSQSR